MSYDFLMIFFINHINVFFLYFILVNRGSNIVIAALCYPQLEIALTPMFQIRV
jgi:hypothetical protein